MFESLSSRLESTFRRLSGRGTLGEAEIDEAMGEIRVALLEAAAPEIRVSTRPEARGALLTVSDNGGGFPKEILARAFEPYVTTKAKGTGLGLAIVKKIVDEHHGQIEIANAAPRGAQVRIRLPLAA